MLKQKLEELKEKERKFEERIKLHKLQVEKEIDLKRKFHSYQR